MRQLDVEHELDIAGVDHVADVDDGCIRIANDEITRLSRMLPLGTPVFITR